MKPCGLVVFAVLLLVACGPTPTGTGPVSHIGIWKTPLPTPPDTISGGGMSIGFHNDSLASVVLTKDKWDTSRHNWGAPESIFVAESSYYELLTDNVFVIHVNGVLRMEGYVIDCAAELCFRYEIAGDTMKAQWTYIFDGTGPTIEGTWVERYETTLLDSNETWVFQNGTLTRWKNRWPGERVTSSYEIRAGNKLVVTENYTGWDSYYDIRLLPGELRLYEENAVFLIRVD